MLKDIYSPLEIDDQWDQRAPSHEDKVEGGNPDGMGSVPPQMQAEDPSGGVAVMDQPTAPDMPVAPEVASPETPAMNEAPSTTNEEEPTGTGSITNIGQMTVPAETVDSPNDTNTTAMAAEEAPVTMESTSTDAPGTETPDVASDDDAATMLDSGQQSETAQDEAHDIPASPYGSSDPEADTPDTTVETEAAIPTTTVEPDNLHRTTGDTDAIQTIVEQPFTDDEREKMASDADQMPISPEPDVSKTESTDNDEVTAEVNRGMEKVLKAIEAELEALENRKSRLQEALTKHEQDRADADAQATATQAQIDRVEAAISELESKK